MMTSNMTSDETSDESTTGKSTTDALAEDPRPDDLRSAPSLVVVNTGNGKGKSSAAFGVMLRGLAAGWNVAVCQFIKSSEWKVGEEKIGRQLGVDWNSFGDGFTWDSNDIEHDKALAAAGWQKAKDLIAAGEHQLIILDELTYLCTWGWIDEADVLATITGRPERVNLVITGRDAPAGLIDIADTVTEMTEVKHAYQQGIRAKRGIDY
jgi:cob(I)alamin adenosyltransferase